MVHARATFRPRCLRLLAPPPAATFSSCRLPCRRSASSAAALAVKPAVSTPPDAPRKVRRLPSLKPAAAQARRSTAETTSELRSTTPSPLDAGANSEFSRPVAGLSSSSSERSRAAGTTASRARTEPLQQPSTTEPALTPEQERDMRALAELSEESRLLKTVKKKALRKYEDAFWRSFMSLGREPPPRSETVVKASIKAEERTPIQPELEAPRTMPAGPTPAPHQPKPVCHFHDHLAHYATLGFSPTDFVDLPSDEALKLARIHLQAEAHPDLPGGNVERSSRINQAYDALSSLDKRKRYQAQGARARPS